MKKESAKLVDELISDKGMRGKDGLDGLMPIVYDELRKLAASFLRRENAVSMQTTELVHEAYFRLTAQRSVDWENRGQFFAIAAQAMRRILIDSARQRHAAKREGVKINLDDAPTISSEDDQNLLYIDEALRALEEIDPLQARIVELRYFAGLTIDETAMVVSLSPATVKREWSFARAWLFRRISDE
ncbi:MAG: ECF-type sigma factor [Pyrinomonadaceae bacterium]